MFLSALARPRGERAAWLSGNCRDDAELLREVELLLLHHDQLEGGATLPGAAAPEDAMPAALGAYRILGVLGRGGMGVVYRAQRGAEIPVALKVLRHGLLSPAILGRFDRETEVLGRLDHPGIARLFEGGTFETPAGPRPYLAMELVDGEDLRAWAGGNPPLEARLELLARVCDAVDHAHGLGVVHRDLKPENVLVRADGSPSVLDFGVAALTGSDQLTTVALTSTGVLVGTVRYMSPEQADASRGAVDARSDVYSLGVVAHELLSGVMPYDVPADSLHRALVAVLTSPPRPLTQVPGARGRGLEAVLACALAKSPADRYASAAGMASDLRRVAAGGRPRARRPRRPLTPSRLLLPMLLVLLAGVAAGEWLGWRESLLPRLPGAGSRGSGAARAIALLDAASVDIYGTPRDAAGVHRGVARCDSAVRALDLAPDGVSGRQLERIAWAMAMDAHLWLGDHASDALEYEACIAAAERAVRVADSDASAAPAPAPGDPELARLADSRARNARAVMALAACKLAGLKQPRTNLRRALEWNAAALALVDVLPPGAAAAGPEQAARLDVSRRVLLSERGIMLVQAGGLSDSVAPVRDGLRLLEESLAPGEGESAVRMMVPAYLRSGSAWAQIARIEESPAAFDSALAYLALAFARSRGVARGAPEAQSLLLLAEAHRLRARASGSRESARQDLATALDRIERRLAEPPGALHPSYMALLGLRREQVRLDLAALGQAPALAESALAGLDRVAPQFSPRAQPLACADIAIERARANALLWTLRGDPAMREAASRRLAEAGRLAPADEDPGRSRRIRAGMAALRDGTRGTADFWRPVASGSLSLAQYDRIARVAGRAD